MRPARCPARQPGAPGPDGRGRFTEHPRSGPRSLGGNALGEQDGDQEGVRVALLVSASARGITAEAGSDLSGARRFKFAPVVPQRRAYLAHAHRCVDLLGRAESFTEKPLDSCLILWMRTSRSSGV